MSKYPKRDRDFSHVGEGSRNQAQSANNRLYYARAYEGRDGLKEAFDRRFLQDPGVSDSEPEPVSR
jgi:hypothetical protein